MDLPSTVVFDYPSGEAMVDYIMTCLPPSPAPAPTAEPATKPVPIMGPVPDPVPSPEAGPAGMA